LKNINVRVIMIVLAVAVLLGAASLLIPKTPAQLPENVATGAKGYIYVSAGGEGRWFELPEEETSLTLRRAKDDGTEVENTIAVTKDGAYMAFSTCENQDCVMQGEVTLQNKQTRVLQNLIVCLPNEVYIELYSAEEMAQLQAAE